MTLPMPLLALCIACALCGCRSASETTAASTAAPVVSDRALAIIRGRATYPERVKMPPGADLVVRLVDSAHGNSSPGTIAETRLEDVAGPPYDFSLRYDPARLRAAGRYALRAALHGPDGQLWFATASDVPVTPGMDGMVELRMMRMPGPD